MTAKKKSTAEEIHTAAKVAKPAELEEDNWEHRSIHMRCKTCMSYAGKASKSGIIKLGRCKHNAPTMSGFPVVFPTDWCGEHKIDENKI